MFSDDLIEELSDEELASCVGGTGLINSAGNKVEFGWTAKSGLIATVLNTNSGPKVLSTISIDSFTSFITVVSDLTFDPNGSARLRCDRQVKANVESVDVQDILQRVAELPITTWNYQDEAAVRHIGPMAQDFAAAFSVGDNDTSIHAVDLHGVTIAAIQAIYLQLQQRDAEIEKLRSEMQALKQQLKPA